MPREESHSRGKDVINKWNSAQYKQTGNVIRANIAPIPNRTRPIMSAKAMQKGPIRGGSFGHGMLKRRSLPSGTRVTIAAHPAPLPKSQTTPPSARGCHGHHQVGQSITNEASHLWVVQHLLCKFGRLTCRFSFCAPTCAVLARFA
jgi:hypothetical protein